METIDKVLTALGAADVDARLEERLVDGVLYAYQEQLQDESVSILLSGFGTVVTALGRRAKPYLPQARRLARHADAPRCRQRQLDMHTAPR